MKSPKLSVVVPALLILVVHHVMATPAIALKLEPTGTSSHMPPLLDCAPAPAGAARSGNVSAFRDNLLALLGALPPATAEAASTSTGGFVAAARSSGAFGGERAFGRAFCFGFGPSACLDCLSAAAQDVADGFHGGRRGAVWRAGCFIAYADTNASTAREEAWRGWFYDDRAEAHRDWFGIYDDTPAAACTATAAECARWLNESAQLVPALKEGRQLTLVHGAAVVVVGYSCYMRVPLLPAATRWLAYALGVSGAVVVLVIEIGGILCCIRIARQFNLNAAAA